MKRGGVAGMWGVQGKPVCIQLCPFNAVDSSGCLLHCAAEHVLHFMSGADYL